MGYPFHDNLGFCYSPFNTYLSYLCTYELFGSSGTPHYHSEWRRDTHSMVIHSLTYTLMYSSGNAVDPLADGFPWVVCLFCVSCFPHYRVLGALVFAGASDTRVTKRLGSSC